MGNHCIGSYRNLYAQGALAELPDFASDSFWEASGKTMLSNSDVKKKKNQNNSTVFHVGFFKNNTIFGASTGEILGKKSLLYIFSYKVVCSWNLDITSGQVTKLIAIHNLGLCLQLILAKIIYLNYTLLNLIPLSKI